MLNIPSEPILQVALNDFNIPISWYIYKPGTYFEHSCRHLRRENPESKMCDASHILLSSSIVDINKIENEYKYYLTGSC